MPASRYLSLVLIPLRPAGLISLVAISAALAASQKAHLFGIPLITILLSWFFKYSFVFLDRLFGGQDQAPVLSVDMITGSLGEFRWLVLLMLVVTAFLATGAGSFLLGSFASATAALGLLTCLPAVLAIQGWTGRLRHSLNPQIWSIAAKSLGIDYAWVVVCGILIAILCIAVPAIFSLPFILRIGLLLYAWLALVALTGGASYANRRELEDRLPFLVSQLNVRSLANVEGEREYWLDSIYGSWRANAVENAFHRAMERVEQSKEPIQELRWLLTRLSEWQPPFFSNRIAAELISQLLRDDREGEALRVVKERLTVDPLFQPQNMNERSCLAELATQWGDRRVADALLVKPSD